MALANFNLKSLVYLDVLLETNSVSTTADRMHRSQSAVSHVLAELRATFGDALLVRSGQRMVLTTKAQAIAPRLRSAMATLKALVTAEHDLEPSRLARDVRLCIHDSALAALLPDLDQAIRDQAPGVNLAVLRTMDNVVHALRHGQLDIAIDVYSSGPSDIEVQPLLTDRLVVIARRAHPDVTDELSIEDYAALPHLAIAQREPAAGRVDALLDQRGLTRRVARSVPSSVQALTIVAETDYIATIPEQLANTWAPRLNLRIIELPVEIPSEPLSMVWHRRHLDDPVHGWLRELIARLAHGARTCTPKRTG